MPEQKVLPCCGIKKVLSNLIVETGPSGEANLKIVSQKMVVPTMATGNLNNFPPVHDNLQSVC